MRRQITNHLKKKQVQANLSAATKIKNYSEGRKKLQERLDDSVTSGSTNGQVEGSMDVLDRTSRRRVVIDLTQQHHRQSRAKNSRFNICHSFLSNIALLNTAQVVATPLLQNKESKSSSSRSTTFGVATMLDLPSHSQLYRRG